MGSYAVTFEVWGRSFKLDGSGLHSFLFLAPKLLISSSPSSRLIPVILFTSIWGSLTGHFTHDLVNLKFVVF